MLLEIKDLTISLPSGEPVAENISFQIERGEMLSIVGSSGAGKTTICKAIMGLLGSAYQATGHITFQGTELLTLPKKDRKQVYGKEICFITQNPMTAFNPSIRVGKQLEKTYRLHHSRSSKGEMQNLFDKTLRRLGLEDTDRILKSYPFALSGGMLQRLMITAALINEPQILIADEATTAIDACNRMELMKELKKLCTEGMSVLFVTHDLRAASFSDHLLIMNHGEVVETGNTQEIIKAPKEEYTAYLLGACRLERRADD
ncbi:ABC transporter ATP-binding protein [Mediterraneibacter glycyrrhizinilyticus]|nr:ABC transporter ATP-binding protein [Mediterraneibacter glycyrrhizinilyticus]